MDDNRPPCFFDRSLELRRLGVDPDSKPPELTLNPELGDPRHRNSQDSEQLGKEIAAVAASKGISASAAADLVLAPQPQEEDPDEHDHDRPR